MMIRLSQRFFLVLATALVMVSTAGCATSLPSNDQPELSYSHLGAYRLDVSSIEVVSHFKPTLEAPNIEHRFPTPPEKALRQWANDRLAAKGTRGTAQFVIRDASVTESRLPIRKGVSGLFHKEQSERYEGKVDVVLRILDSGGHEVAYVEGKATHSTTAGEDLSINEREALWFRLTETMLNDLDRQLDTGIRTHFGPYMQ
ncbi:MAG: hypothetical protein OQJ99_06170 [Rhodospirillales bacterium]|nr:hypothetical protein [Rhodospirillales bacterium]MCW8952386.1 hypothetical protein [Rhodospirillales bacterium]